MLFPKLTPGFALSFILLIIATVLSLSTFVDLNSYAESHDNNNKNISFLSSLSTSRVSDGEELKKSRDVDVNTSSSSASSSSSDSSSSDSSNETSDNKPQLGTLVVMKQVINKGGGDKKPSDFTITVSGNNPTPSSFTGSSSGTTVQLSPGKYQVTESGSTTNYNSTLSNGCSGTIREGETNECTITNTYSVSPPPPPVTTGKINVITKVNNEGGGDKKPSDFTITVSGNNPTPSSFAGSSSGTTITVNEGTYNVKEEEGPYISTDYVPGRYTPSYSSECAGTIQAGETVSCTISNKYNPFIPGILSKLIVTKKVVNEGGGDKKPSDFTITVSGNNPTPSSFAGSSSGTTITVNEGTYNVKEEEGPYISTDYVPGRYTPSYSSECAGTIQAGETVSCTISNKYNPFIPGILSKLIVTKKVVNEGGGDKKPSDFTITVSGNNPTPSSFAGSSSGTTITVNEGTYNVKEEEGPYISTDYVPGRYTPSYSSECAGTIQAGETVSCTISNKYNPFIPGILSKLIVTKKVVNEGGGDKKPSDFTITVSGNNPTPSSFAGSSSGTTITVNEGTYNVKEEEGPYISPDYVPGRYTPSYSSECAGTIQAGETVSCTISNKYNPFIPGILSKLIVTKKVVNEGGGDKKPSDFTITVSGNNPTPSSFAGSSSGTTITLNPGRYSVTENLLSGYTSSMIGDCSGTIDNTGETNECTITNVYQPEDKSAQLI